VCFTGCSTYASGHGVSFLGGVLVAAAVLLEAASVIISGPAIRTIHREANLGMQAKLIIGKSKRIGCGNRPCLVGVRSTESVLPQRGEVLTINASSDRR
jgi:hypothetical protein